MQTLRSLADNDPAAILLELARECNPDGWDQMTLAEVRHELSISIRDAESGRLDLSGLKGEIAEAREARNKAQEYALALQSAIVGSGMTATERDVIERGHEARVVVAEVMRRSVGREIFPVNGLDIPDYVDRLQEDIARRKRDGAEVSKGYERIAGQLVAVIEALGLKANDWDIEQVQDFTVTRCAMNEVRSLLGVPGEVCDPDVAVWIKTYRKWEER